MQHFEVNGGGTQKAISSNDTALLANLLDPGKHRAGRRTVFNPSEAQLLNERIRYAAKKGLAVDISAVKTLLTNICVDGQNSYAGEVPSNAAIRTYRAFNGDITYWKAESKETAKLRG